MIDEQFRDKYDQACHGYGEALRSGDYKRCVSIVEKANEALKTDIFAVVSYFCGKPMFAGELIEHNKRRIEWLRKMQEQPNHA